MKTEGVLVSCPESRICIFANLKGRQSFPYFYPPMTSKKCHVLHSNLLLASLMKSIVSGERVDLRKLVSVVLKIFYTLETLECSQCGCVQLLKSQKGKFNHATPSKSKAEA